MSQTDEERNETVSETMFSGSLDDHQKFKLPTNASLNSILSWSIEHSDPELLKEQLKNKKLKTELTEEDQKWIDILFPDIQKQSNELLDVIKDTSAAAEDVASALDIVQYMSEEIDYANAMEGLGVLSAIVDVACNELGDLECRSLAFWTIGSACVNNAKVRKDVEEYPNLIPCLLTVLRENAGQLTESNGAKYNFVSRAVTALSALLKSQSGLVQFAQGDGFAVFVEALGVVKDEMIRMKIMFNLSKIIKNGTDEKIVFQLYRGKLGLPDVLASLAKELNGKYGDEEEWSVRHNDLMRKWMELVTLMSQDEESKAVFGQSDEISGFLEAVRKTTETEKDDEDSVYNVDREDIHEMVKGVIEVISG